MQRGRLWKGFQQLKQLDKSYTVCSKPATEIMHSIHIGDRPHRCLYNGCGKTFIRSFDMKKHERSECEIVSEISLSRLTITGLFMVKPQPLIERKVYRRLLWQLNHNNRRKIYVHGPQQAGIELW